MRPWNLSGWWRTCWWQRWHRERKVAHKGHIVKPTATEGSKALTLLANAAVCVDAHFRGFPPNVRAEVCVPLFPSVVGSFWGCSFEHLSLRGRQSALSSFRESPPWMRFRHRRVEASLATCQWRGPRDMFHHTHRYYLPAKWSWFSPLISWGSFFL